MTTTAAPARQGWWLAIGVLVPVLVVLAVYHPAADASLVDDDFQWIETGMVLTPRRLVALGERDHFYRPAVELYFTLAHRTFGCDARALHQASVAIHIVNCLLVLGVGWELTRRADFAAIGSIVFASQSSFVQAVTWVSAVTALLSVLGWLLSLWLYLQWRRQGRAWKLVASWASVAFALGAHESAITLVPALLLAGSLIRRADQPSGAGGWLARYRHLTPFVALALAYAILTAIINSRNYVVTGGHYAVGPHIASNLFHYLVALYVGKRSWFDYAALGAVLAAQAVWGPPRMRVWIAWILVSLIPVLPFTWGMASRYLYLPAIPFAWLVADVILSASAWLARWTDGWTSVSWRRHIPVGVAVAATAVIAVRGASFGRKGVAEFVERTAPYAELMRAVREQDAGAAVAGRARPRTIEIARPAGSQVDAQYLAPLARVALCDPDVGIKESNESKN
jgi:hypothetical protein